MTPAKIVKEAERTVGVPGCLAPENSKKRDRRSLLARRVATWLIARDRTVAEAARITGISERTLRYRIATMIMDSDFKPPSGLMGDDALEVAHAAVSVFDVLPARHEPVYCDRCKEELKTTNAGGKNRR